MRYASLRYSLRIKSFCRRNDLSNWRLFILKCKFTTGVLYHLLCWLKMPLRNWFACEQTYCAGPIFNITSISCKVISFILIKKVISLVVFLVLAFIGQLFDIFPLTELFAALNSVTLQWSILPHFQACHLHFREHAIILKEASRLLYFSFKFSQN